MFDFKKGTIMKIKQYFTLALLISFTATLPAGKIILTHPVIEFIDGAIFGINGEVIGFMLKVRHKVLELVNSTKLTPILSGNPTAYQLLTILHDFEIAASKLTAYTERANKAILDHQPITTALSPEEIIENKHLQETFSLILLVTIEKLITNKSNWTAEENNKLENAYKDCLQKAKSYFHEIVEPFIIHARGAKSQMLALIEESCVKRHRTKSLLRGWGAAEEGTEVKHFDLDVQSFEIYKLFCNDLTNFLEDLMRSCPRGLAQFKKIVQEEKLKHQK